MHTPGPLTCGHLASHPVPLLGEVTRPLQLGEQSVAGFRSLSPVAAHLCMAALTLPPASPLSEASFSLTAPLCRVLPQPLLRLQGLRLAEKP